MISNKSANCIHTHNILLQAYPLVPWKTTRCQEMDPAKDIEREMLEGLGHVINPLNTELNPIYHFYNMAEKISVGKP